MLDPKLGIFLEVSVKFFLCHLYNSSTLSIQEFYKVFGTSYFFYVGVENVRSLPEAFNVNIAL